MIIYTFLRYFFSFSFETINAAVKSIENLENVVAKKKKNKLMIRHRIMHSLEEG